MMPGMDGYETCRRIREDPATSFIPVVMVTASGDAEKVRAIEAGADDFVTKPLNQAELLARVRSLVRVKRYHDTVVAQAAALAEWNQKLEARVGAQVDELERLGRLRRFLSPQVAQLVVDTRGRVVPAEPPPRDRLGLHRPAGLHRLRRERPSRRRPWRCWPSTTRRSASSSSPTRGPSSTSPATGCSSSSTTRSPARTRRTARCGWRWTCGPGSPSWRRRGAARARPRLRGRASPRATPRSGGSGSPAATTTPPSARSPTSPPGSAPMARAGQILVTQRVWHGIVGPVDCREVGPARAQGIQPAGGGARGHRLCTRTEVSRMSDVAVNGSSTRRARRGRPQRGLRRAPGADAGGVARHAARTTRASRWSSCRR